MSSSDDTTRTPTTVRALACLVAGVRDAARAVSDVLAAEPALLAEVPDETLEALTLELHDAVDAATASATRVECVCRSRPRATVARAVAGDRCPSHSRNRAVEA